ncbi:MAG: hypothetical protein ABII01_01275 [Candidatus Woesearchaeota archaeon]
MVKKFFTGLLKKKEEAPAIKEDVPDELPSLAEDTIKEEEPAGDKPKEREEGKEKEEPDEEKESDEGIPDDFPPLEDEKPPEEEKTVKELGKIGKDKKVEQSEDKKEPIQHHLEKPKAGTEMDKGFFSELLSVVEEKGINEGILRQDFSKRMKDYWYFHPQEKGKTKSKEHLEHGLFEQLHQLKRLEERWVAQKKFLEEDKIILLEQERGINAKTEELQRILNQLEFYKDVSPDKCFVMKNGMTSKNLHELMSLVEVIDNDTFNHHISKGRNDFSDWIKHVVGNEELAKKVSAVKTREEMLMILENASIGNIYLTDPEKYFRMKDGRVIRDIKELFHNLKEINDSTFELHVNKKRNDFSTWIRDVFKNDYLADKLLSVKSKDETINILDDFFKF